MEGHMMKEDRRIKEETGSSMNMQEGIDQVTGLYFGRVFFQKVQEYLNNIDGTAFCMVAVDIENFRLFNKLYGRQQGDCVLKAIGDCLREFCREKGGVAGYLFGDNFGVLVPYDRRLTEQIWEKVNSIIKFRNDTFGFRPIMGIYHIQEVSELSETIYDRATMAISFARENHVTHSCEYSPDMERKLERELWILTEVQKALERQEITFYVQPQCDISRGKIVGAEALVRWKHKKEGFISPGEFIPVLEKNGLIRKLDRYVWRKVCKWLRQLNLQGYEPVPISINVSRIDIFSMDVPAYLKSLMKEYQISSRLLKVEITESAYTENNDKVVKAVRQLRDADFLVMMDDFGSGYSSLNMLKNIAVDVLKLDMRFLDIRKEEEEKGIGILESIVNMARQLRIPVIVEGVENQTQENFLMKMGCRYTQGYYYYKPMPVEEFEKLLIDRRNLDLEGLWCKQVESIRIREFLDPTLFDDIVINNILGAVAFYDVYENQIEIMRVNEQYFKLLGISSQKEENATRKFWNNVRDDDRQLFFAMFDQAYANQVEGAQGYVHFLRTDGITLRIYMKIFFLREENGHKIFYGALANIRGSEEKQVMEQQTADITQKQLGQIECYYGNLPCAYGILRLILDPQGNPRDYEFVYANRMLARECGYNMDRLRYLVKRILGNEETATLRKAYRAACQGENVECHIYNPLSCKYLNLVMGQYQYGYCSCMIEDITHFHIYENALNHALRAFREVYFIHLQEDYCRMIYPDDNHLLGRGNYQETINIHFGTGKILPYDEDEVRKFLSLRNLKEMLTVQDSLEYKYRRSVDGIGEEWCLTSIHVCEREGGVPKTAVLTIKSIDHLIREQEEHKRQYMSGMLASMSDGFFVYNDNAQEKILYANPAVYQIFGCETMEEFYHLTGNTFSGMVHPEDRVRVNWEIKQQIAHSDKNMDYIFYRIIRKDGGIRWIDDCGHLEEIEGECDQFYVFITDVTDTMLQSRKESLIRQSQVHNERVRENRKENL